jgi:hypothetical protein
MESEDKVYIDMESWGEYEQKLGEMFNGKSLEEIRKCLPEINSSTKDNLIIVLLELSVNLQENDRRNNYLLEPLFKGYRF